MDRNLEYIFAEDNFTNIRTLYDNGLYYRQISEVEGALISFSSCASIIETLLNIYNKKKQGDAGRGIPPSQPSASATDIQGATDATIKASTELTQKLLGDDGGKWEDISDCTDVQCEKLITSLNTIKQRVLGQIETLQGELQRSKAGQNKADDNDDDNKQDWDKICTKVENLVFEGKNCIFFDDLAGLKKEKKMIIDSLVNPLIYPNLYPAVGKGFLLYGPPGTGKTLIAKAAVNQLQIEDDSVSVLFFAPTGAQLKGKYVGETEKKITHWFNCASKAACDCQAASLAAGKQKKTISVLFLDEIDSIAKNRAGDESGIGSNSVNTLLQMMDGIDSKDNVAVIGATNYPWKIDAAVLRRFDTQILLPLPQGEAVETAMMLEFNKFIKMKKNTIEACNYWNRIKSGEEEEKEDDAASGCITKCSTNSDKLVDLYKKAPYNMFNYSFINAKKNHRLHSMASVMSSTVFKEQGMGCSFSDIAKIMQRAANFTATASLDNNLFYSYQANFSNHLFDSAKRDQQDLLISSINLPISKTLKSTLLINYYDALSDIMGDSLNTSLKKIDKLVAAQNASALADLDGIEDLTAAQEVVKAAVASFQGEELTDIRSISWWQKPIELLKNLGDYLVKRKHEISKEVKDKITHFIKTLKNFLGINPDIDLPREALGNSYIYNLYSLKQDDDKLKKFYKKFYIHNKPKTLAIQRIGKIYWNKKILLDLNTETTINDPSVEEMYINVNITLAQDIYKQKIPTPEEAKSRIKILGYSGKPDEQSWERNRRGLEIIVSTINSLNLTDKEKKKWIKRWTNNDPNILYSIGYANASDIETDTKIWYRFIDIICQYTQPITWKGGLQFTGPENVMEQYNKFELDIMEYINKYSFWVKQFKNDLLIILKDTYATKPLKNQTFADKLDIFGSRARGREPFSFLSSPHEGNIQIDQIIKDGSGGDFVKLIHGAINDGDLAQKPKTDTSELAHALRRLQLIFSDDTINKFNQIHTVLDADDKKVIGDTIPTLPVDPDNYVKYLIQVSKGNYYDIEGKVPKDSGLFVDPSGELSNFTIITSIYTIIVDAHDKYNKLSKIVIDPSTAPFSNDELQKKGILTGCAECVTNGTFDDFSQRVDICKSSYAKLLQSSNGNNFMRIIKEKFKKKNYFGGSDTLTSFNPFYYEINKLLIKAHKIVAQLLAELEFANGLRDHTSLIIENFKYILIYLDSINKYAESQRWISSDSKYNGESLQSSIFDDVVSPDSLFATNYETRENLFPTLKEKYNPHFHAKIIFNLLNCLKILERFSKIISLQDISKEGSSVKNMILSATDHGTMEEEPTKSGEFDSADVELVKNYISHFNNEDPERSLTDIKLKTVSTEVAEIQEDIYDKTLHGPSLSIWQNPNKDYKLKHFCDKIAHRGNVGNISMPQYYTGYIQAQIDFRDPNFRNTYERAGIGRQLKSLWSSIKGSNTEDEKNANYSGLITALEKLTGKPSFIKYVATHASSTGIKSLDNSCTDIYWTNIVDTRTGAATSGVGNFLTGKTAARWITEGQANEEFLLEDAGTGWRKWRGGLATAATTKVSGKGWFLSIAGASLAGAGAISGAIAVSIGAIIASGAWLGAAGIGVVVVSVLYLLGANSISTGLINWIARSFMIVILSILAGILEARGESWHPGEYFFSECKWFKSLVATSEGRHWWQDPQEMKKWHVEDFLIWIYRAITGLITTVCNSIKNLLPWVLGGGDNVSSVLTNFSNKFTQTGVTPISLNNIDYATACGIDISKDTSEGRNKAWETGLKNIAFDLMAELIKVRNTDKIEPVGWIGHNANDLQRRIDDLTMMKDVLGIGFECDKKDDKSKSASTTAAASSVASVAAAAPAPAPAAPAAPAPAAPAAPAPAPADAAADVSRPDLAIGGSGRAPSKENACNLVETAKKNSIRWFNRRNEPKMWDVIKFEKATTKFKSNVEKLSGLMTKGSSERRAKKSHLATLMKRYQTNEEKILDEMTTAYWEIVNYWILLWTGGQNKGAEQSAKTVLKNLLDTLEDERSKMLEWEVGADKKERKRALQAQRSAFSKELNQDLSDILSTIPGDADGKSLKQSATIERRFYNALAKRKRTFAQRWTTYSPKKYTERKNLWDDLDTDLKKLRDDAVRELKSASMKEAAARVENLPLLTKKQKRIYKFELGSQNSWLGGILPLLNPVTNKYESGSENSIKTPSHILLGLENSIYTTKGIFDSKKFVFEPTKISPENEIAKHFRLLGVEESAEEKAEGDDQKATVKTYPVSRVFLSTDVDGENIFEFKESSLMEDVKKKIKVLDILPAELSRAMALSYDPVLVGNLENYDKNKTKFLENYAAGKKDKKGKVKM